METKALLQYFREKESQMVAELQNLVELESPSHNKILLDRFIERFMQRVNGLADDFIVHPNSEKGNVLFTHFRNGTPETARPALILCHYDTVWSEGTLTRMPLNTENGDLFGPGVLDMKGGIVIVEFALKAIQELRLKLPRPVIWLLNGDEEVGSITSRKLIEKIAREVEYALVMEPPLANGELKTARKGTGRFVLTIQGIEAHSGINPEDGASAIHEMAHQILAVMKLADSQKETTINVGVISGGTRPNVVAGTAEAQIDVRVWYQSEADRVVAGLRSLKPVIPGTKLQLTGGFTRPPMERSDKTIALFHRASKIARKLNLHLKEGKTGGASDGNFTAALGIPTLDGLGPIGAGAHAPNEHIRISSLPERAALLTALLLEL